MHTGHTGSGAGVSLSKSQGAPFCSSPLVSSCVTQLLAHSLNTYLRSQCTSSLRAVTLNSDFLDSNCRPSHSLGNTI